MKESQVMLFLDLLLEGLEGLRWGDELWEFSRKEGIDVDQNHMNRGEASRKVVDYLIAKTKTLLQGGIQS